MLYSPDYVLTGGRLEGISLFSLQRTYLAERLQSDHMIGGWVPLHYTGLSKAQDAPYRVIMTLTMFLYCELSVRRYGLIRAKKSIKSPIISKQ